MTVGTVVTVGTVNTHIICYVITYYTYLLRNHQHIKIFVVCVSVCDGCGRGSNEFAGRVQNYRVPCAKLSRAFQLSQNFLEM